MFYLCYMYMYLFNIYWFKKWSSCRIICVSIKSNATGATNGAGTAYSSRACEFTLNYWWHLFYSISFLCNLLSTIVGPFVHLSVVLSVFLQFMTSDYPFDIFKLVFILNKAVYLDILSSNNCIVYFMVFRSLKKKSGCSYNRSLKYKYNFAVF
jgi:hypothetical protein